MTGRDAGLVVLGLGVVLVIVGGLIWLGVLGWLGHLPGDIRAEGEGGRVRFFAPLASILVVSLVLSLVVNVVRRVFR